MKQYLPKKPVKRGFKVWVVADSSKGFFLDVDVYVGRPSDGNTTEHGLGERVVLQLSDPFRGQWFRFFCDNFFTSPKLFTELHSRGLYACGTVRQDRRGCPNELKGIVLQRGESLFRQCGNLTATVWQDKRQVSILSTLSDPTSMESVSGRERDGSKVSVPCPTSIITYNKHMAGVDKGDQLRQYHSVRLKCNKNYKYIFWFMFDVAITNAFILSKFCVATPNSADERKLKQFEVNLANSLIGECNSRLRLG